MNSIKTAFVSLVLLGVLYGMYQVLNTPQPEFDSDGYAYVPEAPPIETGEEIDPAQLFAEGLTDSTDMEIVSNDQAPPLMDEGAEEIQGYDQEPLGRYVPDEAYTGDLDTSNSLNPNDNSIPEAGRSTPVATHSASPSQPAGSGSFVPPSTGNYPADNGTGGSFSVSGGSSPTSVPSALATRSRDELSDEEFERRLNSAWAEVESLIDQQQFATALQELTYYYGDPRLSDVEQDNMLTWLDALAAKVIYSTEHHVADAYIVKATDSLGGIAQAHGIPEDLLYNINQSRFGNDGDIFAGMELKIVRGPFHGEIDISDQTLTVFADQAYAGRFRLTPAAGTRIDPGSYFVVSRSNGLTDGASSMSGYRVTLSNGLNLQENGTGNTPPAEGIGMAMNDMFDAYSILSNESVITIVE